MANHRHLEIREIICKKKIREYEAHLEHVSWFKWFKRWAIRRKLIQRKRELAEIRQQLGASEPRI